MSMIIYQVTVEENSNIKDKEKPRSIPQYRITWSNPGDARGDFFFQPEPVGIQHDMATIWRFPEQYDHLEQRWMQLGVKLFRFLDGDSRVLEQALGSANKRGEPLQIHLQTCPRVADWPFELLARENGFLLPANEQVHLVRRVSDRGVNKTMRPKKKPLELLFMACSPQGVHPVLDYEKEEDTIFRVTEKLPLNLEIEDSGSLEGLKEWLTTGYFDVVHLSGHADIDKTDGPFFLMEQETGRPRLVFPKELAEQALINNRPRLLFLSGCRTGEKLTGNEASLSFANDLVAKHNIPTVLGWGRPVSDQQAIRAEKMIYQDLSRGKSILEAVWRARHELRENFSSSRYPAWPLLRLFSDGTPLTKITSITRTRASVVSIHDLKPKIIKYRALVNSGVQVLEEGFIGRRRQLQQIQHILRDDLWKNGALILGSGGLGKSCLAGKTCERLKHHELIVVHGKLDEFSLRHALSKAFIRNQDNEGERILNKKGSLVENLPALCSSNFAKNNYLLILDDFEQNIDGAANGHPGYLLAEASMLLKTLLQSLDMSNKKTQIIITSRYDFTLTARGEDLVNQGLEKIWLTGFGEVEQNKKKRELHNIFYTDKQGLVSRLMAAGQGNPLLMEKIDHLLSKPISNSNEDIFKEIKKEQEAFNQALMMEELLATGGEELARLLRRFSIYRLFVTVGGVQSLSEQCEIDNWLELLNRGLALSLVEYDQVQEGYRLTPLLREKFLHELDQKEKFQCHQAALLHYKNMSALPGPFDPITAGELTFHALECAEDETASRQGAELVRYYRENLELAESLRIGQWILRSREKKENSPLKTAADSELLNELAITFKELREADAAIDLYHMALEIDRTLYGENHLQIARDLNNLGLSWSTKNNHKKAIECFEQALEILNGVQGSSAEKTILEAEGFINNNLGTAWIALDNPKASVRYLEQSLLAWQKIYDEYHPRIGIVTANLGAVYEDLGDIQRAIKCYEKALEINRSQYDEFHPEIAGILNNLGALLSGQGNFRGAAEYYEQALLIWEKIYGKSHQVTETSRQNLETSRKKAKE